MTVEDQPLKRTVLLAPKLAAALEAETFKRSPVWAMRDEVDVQDMSRDPPRAHTAQGLQQVTGEVVSA